MFTSYDKAIAAFLVPLILQLLAHFGLPNSDQTTSLITGIVTAAITLIAVYLTPNKGAAYLGPNQRVVNATPPDLTPKP